MTRLDEIPARGHKGRVTHDYRTYKRDGGIIEDSLSALVDQLWGARETNGGSLLDPAVLGLGRHDVSLDRQGPIGEIAAQPPEVGHVLGVDG